MGSIFGMAGSALMSVVGSIMTKALFESMIKKITIYGLKKLVASTKNTLDDEIVADIVVKLK